MIITHKELKLIQGQREGQRTGLALDFGTKEVTVEVKDGYAVIDGHYRVDLNSKLKENFCYLIKQEEVIAIAFFSDDTNRFYKLLPTNDWPTFTIGSVPMHRISRLSPKEDTQNKIRILKPKGVVLDTCMGLGYTAIGASGTSTKVYTFEPDSNVYFLASLNPISRPLFTAHNIIITREDISQHITQFDDEYFDCILHDPPTFPLAPALYSPAFYRELLRVLKRKGRLFHYTPLCGVKRGHNFPQRVKGKLKEAGFRMCADYSKEVGILCQK